MFIMGFLCKYILGKKEEYSSQTTYKKNDILQKFHSAKMMKSINIFIKLKETSL